MSSTVDANVLVYAANERAPEQAAARDLLDRLAAGPALVYFLWPTLLGFLRIATHPKIFPYPLSPAQAADSIESLITRPHVRAVGEGERFWANYRRVASQSPPRGNAVPDVHLVALMRLHGVSTIYSRDRGLRRFDGITVVDPFATES
jgi:toxin-antitoxin system PIN domain toxin